MLGALLLLTVLAAPGASAASGDLGYRDGSFAGAGDAPTADKPQSKLWFNDGSWWADLFDPASRTWHVFRLDRGTETWTDTGTRIDDRAASRADVLWDGAHLYVASQVPAANSQSNVAGQPARLFRYSYAGGTYTLDAGFPVAVNDVSSESLTLDRDSTGTLWATWTQDRRVYVNSTTGSDLVWGTPFALPVTGATGLSADDISSLAAFGGDRVGLMWSNQTTSTFFLATHADGAARTSWTVQPAWSDPSVADDHLNLKQFAGGSGSRLFAAVKTSLDATGSSSAAQNVLLGLDTATGTWTRTVFGTVADCHTRPTLVVDETNEVLHLFATAPSTGSSCPGSGTPGTIYEKTAPIDHPSFAPGRGNPVIRDSTSANLNNVTASKHGTTAATGIVVLAGDDVTQRYWHADLPISGTPTSGTPTGSVAYGGGTATGQSAAVTGVSLTTPTGTATGDLLVAAFTANDAPTVTAPPGWTAITTLRPSGASLFAYSRTATAGEPDTWTWTLSAPAKWSGGISRYVGVDTGHPLDSSVSTAVSGSGASVTVPGVTTTTTGAMLIGAMGADSGKVTGTAPPGWTLDWQDGTGQLAASAHRPATVAGAQPSTSWGQTGTVPMAAWTVALRPAPVPVEGLRWRAS